MTKNPPANAGLITGWEDPLEGEMATHSSILAWSIPRTGEPGRLQSMGSQGVGHDEATESACTLEPLPSLYEAHLTVQSKSNTISKKKKKMFDIF